MARTTRDYRKLPYGYVLIKGKDKVAMVDVGFNNKELGATFASMYGVQNWHSPREILAQCDVTPEQVTDIFITHAHFDHIGGTASSPMRPSTSRSRSSRNGSGRCPWAASSAS